MYVQVADTTVFSPEVGLECVFAIEAYLLFYQGEGPVKATSPSGCQIAQFAFGDGGGPFRRNDRANKCHGSGGTHEIDNRGHLHRF